MTVNGNSAKNALVQLAGRDDVDLIDTALLLARLERPDSDTDFRLFLAELAQQAATAEKDVLAQVGHLSALLSGRHGFAVVDPDEPDHANFMDMLESREGSAEALGILWIALARTVGWPAEALAFPAVFVIRLTDERGQRLLIDPSIGGLPVEPQDLRAMLKAANGLGAELERDHFQPLDDRAILVRLQNEEKLRHLRRGRVPQALELVESILLFAPDRAELWREAGMMHLRLDHMPAAIAALEQYVARVDNCAQKRRTQMLLQDLRSRLL